MFERFTDRARRVLVYAQDEARQLDHDFIGPEHLLLGLFRAGGIAATALGQVGADLDAARRRVAEAISPARGKAAARGKATPNQLPFSPQAKKTLELALREALRLKHNYIGTEHLLLGLLRVADKGPGAVGTVLGVDAEVLRSRVIELLDRGLPAPKLPTPAAEKALDSARELAGSTAMTTGHVVAAVLADPRSQGAKALASLGVTAETFAEALARVPIDATSDGRTRSMEIKVGDTTTTIEDPELIDALGGMSEDQLRTTFDLLKVVIQKTAGPEAAA